MSSGGVLQIANFWSLVSFQVHFFCKELLYSSKSTGGLIFKFYMEQDAKHTCWKILRAAFSSVVCVCKVYTKRQNSGWLEYPQRRQFIQENLTSYIYHSIGRTHTFLYVWFEEALSIPFTRKFMYKKKWRPSWRMVRLFSMLRCLQKSQLFFSQWLRSLVFPAWGCQTYMMGEWMDFKR